MHPALHADRANRPALLWDIYCRVVDNLGDIGVCWRLAADLAARGQRVRLWTDDARPLDWMTSPERRASVEVLAWPTGPQQPKQQGTTAACDCGDVVIEAFGCELPISTQEALAKRHAQGRPAHWINLEYLSAEPHAKRNNGLPSPVMSGPAKGLCKTFVFPGFEPGTAGLLLEAGLLQRRAAARSEEARHAWRNQWRLAPNERAVSLFCYEPPALPALLQRLADCAEPVALLVTAGRAQRAVAQAWQALGWPRKEAATGWAGSTAGLAGASPFGQHHGLRCLNLPWLTQQGFDDLLWHGDLNLVRGEDSLVRALWAGQPFVWQAYRQDDGAHHAKVQAFLDVLQAPPTVQHWHQWWNLDLAAEATGEPAVWPWELPEWASWLSTQIRGLSAWCDLSEHLLRLVAAHPEATVESGASAQLPSQFKG